MGKKIRIYKRSLRLREILEFLLKKYNVKCYFCGKDLLESLPKRRGDYLTIHHLDGNRNNNSIENLVLAHRRCHKAYHLKISKQKQDKN
jgi:hypothetical protein